MGFTMLRISSSCFANPSATRMHKPPPQITVKGAPILSASVPAIRLRVMSFYTMAFMGVAPFGSLIAGTLADKIGAPLTVICGGGLCILVALWFAKQLKEIRSIVKPIYQELGILPEVATGMQTAAALQTPPE